MMDIMHVADAPLRRELERFGASQEAQDGLIEYVACMADVELPEGEDATEGGAEDGE